MTDVRDWFWKPVFALSITFDAASGAFVDHEPLNKIPQLWIIIRNSARHDFVDSSKYFIVRNARSMRSVRVDIAEAMKQLWSQLWQAIASYSAVKESERRGMEYHDRNY